MSRDQSLKFWQINPLKFRGKSCFEESTVGIFQERHFVDRERQPFDHRMDTGTPQAQRQQFLIDLIGAIFDAPAMIDHKGDHIALAIH